jgi:hypothetical protein
MFNNAHGQSVCFLTARRKSSCGIESKKARIARSSPKRNASNALTRHPLPPTERPEVQFLRPAHRLKAKSSVATEWTVRANRAPASNRPGLPFA